MLCQPYSRLDFRCAGSFPEQRLVSLTLFRQGFLGLRRTRSGAQGPALSTVHDTATTFARVFLSFIDRLGKIRQLRWKEYLE